jgi:hypothetical protein
MKGHKAAELTTSASPSEVVEAFRRAFFTRPRGTDWLRFSKQAVLRRQQSWREVTASGALIAAELARARGAGERLLNSQSGGSLEGIRVAMAVERTTQGSVASIWMVKGRGFLGRGEGSGSVGASMPVAYARFMRKDLAGCGHEATVRKVRDER